MIERGAMSASEAAGALPDTRSLDALVCARPALLAPAELIAMVVSAERLVSHIQAIQMTAVAEFARPGRAGDLSDLIEMLTEKGGQAKLADGTINIDALEVLVNEEARRMASAEIAAALCVSPQGASRRVDTALEMVDELPATLTALREGRIDRARAAVIAERTHLLTPELRSAVEATAIELSETRTPGQCKPMIDRRVIAADPDAARKRTEAARADRFVTRQVGEDGMSTIKANLPAEGAISVFELLDSVARAAAGHDGRSIGARRADALIDICVALLTEGRVDVRPMGAASNTTAGETRNRKTDDDAVSDDDAVEVDDPVEVNDAVGDDAVGDERSHTSEDDAPAAGSNEIEVGAVHPNERAAGSPAETNESAATDTPRSPLSRVMTHHGRAAHLNVTMSATTLAAFADHPAELIGHGAITADVARMIAVSIASLAVIAVNENGHAIAVGATTYPPRQAVRDRVITANPTCRFPACRQPARLCQLDHRDPFDHTHARDGGLTDPANLDPLCHNNHLLKTHTDWSAVVSPSDGLTLTWTSPTGHQYDDAPYEHVLPDQDRQIHDERFCDSRCSRTSPSHPGVEPGIGTAGAGKALAEPGSGAEEQPNQQGQPEPERNQEQDQEKERQQQHDQRIAWVTRRFIERRAEQEARADTRRRIEEIVRRYRARHRPPEYGASGSRALGRLEKLVIQPIGPVEMGLQQLISAAAGNAANATAFRPALADPDQPPF